MFEEDNEPRTAEEANLALFKSKRFCDVTFVFGSKLDKDAVRILAHQIFLRRRSVVFNRMFETSAPGQMVDIEITDTDPDTFQMFLEFVYGDKFDVSVAEASDLLYLAIKFQVGLLRRKCKELLDRGTNGLLVE